MTDKEMNLDDAPKPKADKTAKPRMSKTEASAAEVKKAKPANPVKVNGSDSPADVASKGREALLQVDSYAEAEGLLTTSPDLIEQARAVFGAIVPTTGQNEFMDLAIKAAAEDEAIDLRGALKAKRKQNLNLTGPEVSQLLEFAAENVNKSTVLALNIAILLTDDLTRLENADLWGKQKDILLTAGNELDLDPAMLWDEISREDAPKQVSAPKPVPVKVKAEPEKPKAQKRPVPPPPPVNKPAKGKGPSRLFLVTGFIFLLSALSCGACALGNLF